MGCHCVGLVEPLIEADSGQKPHFLLWRPRRLRQSPQYSLYMAQIELTQSYLLVKLSKSEQIWALHRDLSISVALIKGAEVAHKDVWQTLGLRLPGTALPTYLAYGSYFRFGPKGGWTFALWRSTKANLVITLAKAPNQRYKRIIIAMDTQAQAQELANTINDKILAG